MYYIIVFRSQTQTYAFNGLLQSYKIPSTVMQTPRQAEVSCGLCVKIPFSALTSAKAILSRRAFSSFVGIFLVNEIGNGIKKVMQVG